MIKCPNCGSTAQIRLQKIEEKEISCYTIEVLRAAGAGEISVLVIARTQAYTKIK